jgi:hypothetical protein
MTTSLPSASKAIVMQTRTVLCILTASIALLVWQWHHAHSASHAMHHENQRMTTLQSH